MTAEIIIMNAEAVALAADSAVTADWGGGEFKVLYSQTKIFEFTHSSQVAVMIYGRNHFMSLPLDSIIADYKRKHGHVTYPKLDDYVAAFTDHIVHVANSQLSTEELLAHQLDRVRVIFRDIVGSVETTWTSYVEEVDEREETVSDEELKRVFQAMTAAEAERRLDLLRDVEAVDGFTEELVDSARAEMKPLLKEVREEWFGNDLTADVEARLDEVAYGSIGVMIGDLMSGRLPSVSGIVFAGFGEEELLPSYVEIHVEAAYGQQMRMRRVSEGHIGSEETSIIEPFAQQDMVVMFEEGVRAEYNVVVADVVQSEFEKLCVELATDTELNEETRNHLGDKLESGLSKFVGRVIDQLQDRRANYADGLLQAVESLSKTEMADMAEALISLTSLDRQVKISDESVGGPTDVAVITRGDGFIWIKRKQYFEAGLNPEYFARIYGKGVI